MPKRLNEVFTSARRFLISNSAWNVPDRSPVSVSRKGQGVETMHIIRSLLLAAIFALFGAGLASAEPLTSTRKSA